MVANFTMPKTIAVDFDPFAGPEIAQIAPSTGPQTEIWIACLLGGDNANRSYNLTNTLRLEGALDRHAMTQAVQAVVDRHDALRSVVSPNGEHIYVYKELQIEIFYQDLSHNPAAQKDRLLADYLEQDTMHVFDLLQGPLLKVGLFKVSDQVHELVLTTHHIISDGWSMGVILNDLSVFYSSFVNGTLPDLPEAPSFAEYATRQFQYLSSDDYLRTEAFWLNLYKKKIPVFDLPTDFPRPASRTFDCHRLDYTLEPALVTAVRKVAAKAGCSFATTLLAAFEVLIHRLTGQDDVIIGLPTAGQSITDYQQLAGHCVNLLPLRSQIETGLGFSDFLKQCKKSVLDAHEHQRLTFGSLLRKLNVPRDISRVPLVPIIFNFNRKDGDFSFVGLSHRVVYQPKKYENFELFLDVSGDDQALMLNWTYNTGLYKAETIDQMMSGLVRILETVVADASIAIRDIDFKAEKPLKKNWVPLNYTKTDYPYHTPTQTLIAQTARQQPDKTALVFNRQKISYRLLNETANQLARYLTQEGVQRGDIVGIMLDRSPEMVMILLAVLKAGAAYLPLDPDYPADRLQFMLEDASAKTLITSEKYHHYLNTDTPEIHLETALRESKNHSKEEPEQIVEGNDLAYVLYTSGSTGKPKGVLIEHHNLVNFLWSMIQQPGITPNDTVLAITTISFDIAGLELFLPLIVGASIRLADQATARDGRALRELIETQTVTIMQATPATWRMVLDSGWDKPLPLKVLCGGEPLAPDLADKLIEKTDELWNVYGPTETTVWGTLKHIRKGEPITIGRPIHNTWVYILDEQQQPVADGEIGELWIGGAGVARGYLNRPELTRERFVADPFVGTPGGRMYRTGDLGRLLENGEILCLGRIDHQVKIRGHRIELGEIENTIHQIPEIKEVVVIAREDRPGDQQLVAYVVSESPEINQALPKELVQQWKQQVRQQLPDYMVPRAFVALSKFPITANGKIDRKLLPAPSLSERDNETGFMSPRTDVEKLVAEIWTECLKIENISVFDNFFELGGHSLTAVQVMSLLEKKTGKNLPLATLFEYSTIEKLASILHMNGRSVTWDSLVPIKPHGTKIPLYIVHGAGLHVLLFNTLALSMDPDQPVYGLQAKGINSEDKPLESIEEIAAYYIDAIRAQNPEGPYALAGYSFGGIIAYEMSKQLRKMGKEVKMLAMFDTYAYQSNFFDPWPARAWQNTLTAIKERLYVLTLLKENPRETVVNVTKSVQKKANRFYRKIRYNEDHLKVFHGNYYKVNEANEIASRKYRLEPQEITVTLFRAKKHSYYVDDFEYLGWKPFALNGITIHEVPGDHFNLFTSPNDKEFARILQEVLDRLT
ncbi:amino acid adenylation domain-containing protein [Larkinella sp. GY13]|uniref:amino acid adenylation domain-containing protein n=1 Tax=Larkinella sp. GY13 TaxID=3453720 RepID=UPI003F724E0A